MTLCYCFPRKILHDQGREFENSFPDWKSGEDDRKVRLSSLQPGDRVLVRNLSERGGPGKLRSHGEQEVHLIVEQKGDLPVFEVTPEGRKGKSRILH